MRTPIDWLTVGIGLGCMLGAAYFGYERGYDKGYAAGRKDGSGSMKAIFLEALSGGGRR